MPPDAATIAATIAAFNILVTVGGGFFFLGRITSRMDAHEANTMRLEADVHDMKDLVTSAAVEADRLRRAEADIENVEEDVRNLRRGIGFINDSGARGVNREF